MPDVSVIRNDNLSADLIGDWPGESQIDRARITGIRSYQREQDPPSKGKRRNRESAINCTCRKVPLTTCKVNRASSTTDPGRILSHKSSSTAPSDAFESGVARSPHRIATRSAAPSAATTRPRVVARRQGPWPTAPRWECRWARRAAGGYLAPRAWPNRCRLPCWSLAGLADMPVQLMLARLGNIDRQAAFRVLPFEFGRTPIEPHAAGDQMHSFATEGNLETRCVGKRLQIEAGSPIARNGNVVGCVASKASVVNRRGHQATVDLADMAAGSRK